MFDDRPSIETVVIQAVEKVSGRCAMIDTDFRADLGMDGLDVIDVSLEIEGALGVNLDDAQIEFLTTVRDLVSQVEGEVGK